MPTGEIDDKDGQDKWGGGSHERLKGDVVVMVVIAVCRGVVAVVVDVEDLLERQVSPQSDLEAESWLKCEFPEGKRKKAREMGLVAYGRTLAAWG